MQITIVLKSALFIAAVLVSATASAYSPEEQEVICKKPRFTDFNLTEYKASDNIEVAPEAEFFFKVSPYVDPETITLTAKGQPLPFTVESNSSFHKIKAKIPTALTGNFVRINTTAKSVLGCGDGDGWLVKVAGK